MKKNTQDYHDYYEEEEEEDEVSKDSVKVCNGFFGKWHQKLFQNMDDDDSNYTYENSKPRTYFFPKLLARVCRY